MLLAAFEAEIHNIIKDNNNNNPSTHHQFPFQVTFQFSPTASCVIEWRDGYPAVPLRIVSSRSSSLQEKLRLETALVTFRQHAEECHQQQMEAGLTCCSAALEAWNEYNPNNHVQQQQQEQQQQSTMPTAETNHYPWITGEPIVDRKSSFQAHLCPIESEQDVQPALLQLLHSSTKLQRATHNMVRVVMCVSTRKTHTHTHTHTHIFSSTHGEFVMTEYGNTTTTTTEKMRPDRDWRIYCQCGMKMVCWWLCHGGLVASIWARNALRIFPMQRDNC